MQQVQTRQLNSNSDPVQYAWENDEEAFVDALMGMARNHHMSRWKRIKMAGGGRVERDESDAAVRTLSRPLNLVFLVKGRASVRLFLFLR